MKIEIGNKSGFQTNDKMVRVYDENKNIFYFRNPKKFPFHFNLPPGVYYSNNNLRKLHPRRYKLPVMPKKERDARIPKDVKIVVAPNPNKASIFRERKLVVVDPAIVALSKPQRVFIKLHELGHFMYATEKYCDLFATREMLIRGYNPSQIFLCIHGTLSNGDQSLIRKDYILKNCENSFKK